MQHLGLESTHCCLSRPDHGRSAVCLVRALAIKRVISHQPRMTAATPSPPQRHTRRCLYKWQRQGLRISEIQADNI